MNKVLGAILGAMILAMVTGIIGHMLVHPEELAKPVYMVAGVTEAAPTSAAAQPAGPAPIGPLLAQASAANGKDITHRLCIACHTFDKGDPNRIGPNLYNVFDQPIAEGHGGYPFSSALQAHDKQKWTPDLLNAWLSGPQDFAHGTKMTFVGLPKEKDRADVIAYLDSLSDHPEALTPFETAPKPAAAAKPAAPPAPTAKTPPGQPAQKAPAGPGTTPPPPSGAAPNQPAAAPTAPAAQAPAKPASPPPPSSIQDNKPTQPVTKLAPKADVEPPKTQPANGQ
ncbi:MAG TPA: c-type cytochrome [Stellaceae bacterium]|nr:c-type cytochrome [Stellaceae bacterium]